MKRWTLRLFVCFLALAMLTGMLAGCQPSNEEPPVSDGEQTPDVPMMDIVKDGVSQFRLVRSDFLPITYPEVEGVKALRQAIQNVTGCKLEMATDFEEDSDGLAYEILVGKTERSAYDQVSVELTEEQFLIMTIGNKIQILGGSNFALTKAVDYFIKTYLGDASEEAEVKKDLAVPEEIYIVKSYYDVLSAEDRNIFGLDEAEYALIEELLNSTEEPFDVADFYEFHEDGGMIYNPISREKADQLNKYDDSDKITGTITTTYNGITYTLNYDIPASFTAYDAIPIHYTLTSSKGAYTPVHISATSFDDPEKESETVYYDLNLPGSVDVTWEYLGYVGGTEDLSNRAAVTESPEKDKQGTQYPQYDVTDLIYSGTVKSYDTLWWKFRYTNEGDTILDPEGNGAYSARVKIHRKNDKGKWEEYKEVANRYGRIFEEIYPGESGEMYFTFGELIPGEYKIVIEDMFRGENSYYEGFGKSQYSGQKMTVSEFYVTVAEDAKMTEPQPVQKSYQSRWARNGWLHTYEEFMSSFQSHLTGVETGVTIEETMYVQCPPWCEQVVLRLIVGDGDTMQGVAVPVDVETDSITVELNTDNNNYVVLEDGTRFPAITAQSMADMRGNVQKGPDVAANVLEDLLMMKEVGINMINTTAAFEHDGSFGQNRADNTDACWFMLDAARLLGLDVEGWIGYPFDSSGAVAQAKELFKVSLSYDGFVSEDLTTAHGLNTEWQYMRWGDNYWIAGKDTIVLDAEDTRGWMRSDYNARAPMSEESKYNFRVFLSDLYGSLDALNENWGTSFTSYGQIDPEEGTTEDHWMLSYKSDDILFGEWSRPLELLDIFRTLERIRDYEQILAITEEAMPTAKVGVRTEGANWMAPVGADTDSAHLRHVYYSQRRCGIIAELMGGSEVVYSHADYTTIPYTPSEVAELTRSAVENGVVPILMPMFNVMKDVAINDKYGYDYSYEYNLEEQVLGANITTMSSVFEWYKATYENGGVPGVLWQDYYCDGFVTSTQRKEIAFFAEKLAETIATPEGQKWATEFEQDTSVLDGSLGLYTFSPEYVQGQIERVQSR